MKVDVLYEDNHLVIINKPNGVLTHGDRTGDTPMEDLVKDYIRHKYNKPGNVFSKSAHRIDRPVSGVLIFAKTSKAHERMTQRFRERKIHKVYWALTVRKPIPPNGTCTQYVIKDHHRNVVSWSEKPGENRREAVTEYKVLAYVDPYYLLELHPITGRSHQLRVMLRSKRCPIVGDLKYNGRKIDSGHAILLHSRRVRFEHPVKLTPLDIVAPLPDIPEWEYLSSQYPVDG